MTLLDSAGAKRVLPSARIRGGAMAAVWFLRVMWLGIAVNVALAAPTLLCPAQVLALSHLPHAEPLLWVRFAALLLILLSVFYAPAALDSRLARPNAWLSVGARLAGTVFFLTQAPEYWPLGAIDFGFFLPQSILLLKS